MIPDAVDEIPVLESSRYIYLVRVLTYGADHPIKIGISKNISRRMTSLGQMGIHAPHLLAVYEFATEREARIIEAAACKKFKSWTRYGGKEILDVNYNELSKYVCQFNPVAIFEFKDCLQWAS